MHELSGRQRRLEGSAATSTPTVSDFSLGAPPKSVSGSPSLDRVWASGCLRCLLSLAPEKISCDLLSAATRSVPFLPQVPAKDLAAKVDLPAGRPKGVFPLIGDFWKERLFGGEGRCLAVAACYVELRRPKHFPLCHGMDALCEYSYCSLAASIKEAEAGELNAFPSRLEERLLSNGTNESLQEFWRSFLNLERADGLQGGSSILLRIFISIIYSVVCALGLVGNVLVLYLMKSKWKKSSINLFVTCLAVTDFQFVLTLPFWAVENALDFTWLFGKVMCKMLSYVTAMNMYASVFFLTAMSIARYHAVASALKSRRQGGLLDGCSSAKWLCALIWILAILASLPNGIFSTTSTIFGEELCLVKIPDSQGNNTPFWLGLYHAQKVLLGFLLPLTIITLCYLLLVRFISDRHVGAGSCGPSTKRRSKVTKSVTIVVLSFFLCWLPNQALTTWGVLIKLNLLHFSHAYFLSQAYLFPITVCLAHSNSCLNPIFYCLMRREFRKALKKLLWRIASPSTTTMRPFTATTKPEQEEQALKNLMTIQPASSSAPPPPSARAGDVPDAVCYPPGVVMYSSCSNIFPSITSTEMRC